MTPDPTIMQAVERLGYRVTVGDVATQAGLDVNLAQRGLLALASEAGGHLQVSETGEIAYLFPPNFRSILRNKFFQLRLREWWNRVWRVLFYLIRISFGIVLLVSIALIIASIVLIMIAASASRGNSDDRQDDYGGGGGGMVWMPHFWFGPDLFYVFYPDYYDRRYETRRRSRDDNGPRMNFLEAIFSFLFGDGNPNRDLEDRRWQTIGTVIRNNRGAVVAEQIAPYLDTLGQGYAQEYEEYMLPVLSRFNGRPEVSPEGGIVYHFPELQTTAAQQSPRSVSAYLKEFPWRFSRAGMGQKLVAIGLGSVNIIGALMLWTLLRDGTVAAQMGGLVAFVQSIFWFLVGYGVAFLTVPLLRYFWIQWRNRKIEARNDERQLRALRLEQGDEALHQKIAYAQQFAAETILSQENLAYTTETDLTEQEIARSAQIDAEWQQRLNQSPGS